VEEGRATSRKPFKAVLLLLLHTISVVIELIYVGFILASFSFLDVELIGREG
jgi:hypothetical protein